MTDDCVRLCGRDALDGHLTCGDVECDEAGARLDYEAAWRLLHAKPGQSGHSISDAARSSSTGDPPKSGVE